MVLIKELAQAGVWYWTTVDMSSYLATTTCSCCGFKDDFFFSANGIFSCIECTGKAKMYARLPTK